MKRIPILLAASAVLAFSGTAHAQTEIEIFHAWPAHKRFHEPIAEAFMKENPNIKVTFRNPSPSYDEAHQSVIRGALTGDLPDVFHSGYHLLPPLVRTLAEREQILPLTALMDSEGAEWKAANYSDRILALGTVDGVLYGMPFNASTPIVYYNLDLVKQAGGNPDALPNNWDDLLALAAKISALGDDVDGFSYDVYDWPDDWLWQALVYQTNGDLMNAEGTEIRFGDQHGLDGLVLARRMVTEGKMRLTSFKETRNQFCANKLGIYFTSTAGVRLFSDCSAGNFELKTELFPVVDKENGGVPTGGNAAVILSEDEEKQNAAWDYLKFISGPLGQKIAVLGSGYMPTNLRAVEPEFLGDHYDQNPNWQTSIRQIDYARSWRGYPGTNAVKIWRTQREIIGDVMRGNIEPEAGLKKMVEETNALLPNN